MRYSELTQKLKEAGCYIVRDGSRHDMWYSPITGKKFPVGRLKTQEVPPGTLNSILRDSGMK